MTTAPSAANAWRPQRSWRVATSSTSRAYARGSPTSPPARFAAAASTRRSPPTMCALRWPHRRPPHRRTAAASISCAPRRRPAPALPHPRPAPPRPPPPVAAVAGRPPLSQQRWPRVPRLWTPPAATTDDGPRRRPPCGATAPRIRTMTTATGSVRTSTPADPRPVGRQPRAPSAHGAPAATASRTRCSATAGPTSALRGPARCHCASCRQRWRRAPVPPPTCPRTLPPPIFPQHHGTVTGVAALSNHARQLTRKELHSGFTGNAAARIGRQSSLGASAA